MIFVGPPGAGKTHSGHQLGNRRGPKGRRVYYGTLADLITPLKEAQAAGRLHARLKVLTHPALLVVDEIGYLPITRTGTMLFLQLMTRPYEHASTVLTSNKGFEEWEMFGDDLMAAALIDRLVHHCHLVTILGNGYRIASTPVCGRPFTTTRSPKPHRTPRRTVRKCRRIPTVRQSVPLPR